MIGKCSVILTAYQRVINRRTNERTDRQTDRHTNMQKCYNSSAFFVAYDVDENDFRDTRDRRAANAMTLNHGFV